MCKLTPCAHDTFCSFWPTRDRIFLATVSCPVRRCRPSPHCSKPATTSTLAARCADRIPAVGAWLFATPKRTSTWHSSRSKSATHGRVAGTSRAEEDRVTNWRMSWTPTGLPPRVTANASVQRWQAGTGQRKVQTVRPCRKLGRTDNRPPQLLLALCQVRQPFRNPSVACHALARLLCSSVWLCASLSRPCTTLSSDAKLNPASFR